jgi:hypothetical protein
VETYTSVILQHTLLGGSRCSVVHHRRLHALVVGCASNDNRKNCKPFSFAAGAGVPALSSLSAGQIFAEGEDGCINLVEADGPPETAVMGVGDTQGGNYLTRSPRIEGVMLLVLLKRMLYLPSVLMLPVRLVQILMLVGLLARILLESPQSWRQYFV